MGGLMRRGLLVLAFLLPLAAQAQVLCALGPGVSAYDVSKDEHLSRDTLELAHRVNAALAARCRPNCPEIAIFRNTTAANLMLLDASGQAKVVYSPKFFTTVYNAWGDGAIIALLAHVMGHAINANAPAAWMKSLPAEELRADAWAGCALGGNAVGGRDLGEALTALKKYPPQAPPQASWGQRLPALRLGYTQCGGDGGKFDWAGNPGRR